MTVKEIKNSAPMRYWALQSNASDSQKRRLKKAINSNDYFALLKKDGFLYRYIQEENSQLLQSRTLSKVTGNYVEKQDNVPHIMKDLKELVSDNTVLIGEICYASPDFISSDVTKIMGCKPKKAVERQKDIKLCYYIFDILMLDGFFTTDLPAENRISLVQSIAKKNNSPYLLFAEPIYENIPEQVAKWLEEGEEGAVLMRKKAPYQFGKRTAWDTIKIKQNLTDTLDVVIMGFTEPIHKYTGKYPRMHPYWENLKTGELVEGNYYDNGGFIPVTKTYFKGLIGGFILGAYYNDRLLEVARVASLTDAIRIDATNNPDKYLGRVVELSGMSVDQKLKSIRHPRFIDFRDDKNAEECLYEDIFI